ncbi:MAG: 50S ribosomal protein L28 [Fusobacteriia bacterium 4572_74]|nr:MAG: 50S ribosomal protein L28 [Fusobacteriia bacterium 4572_74]
MKRCEITGKGITFGHSISHAHNMNKRIWKPNLQPVKVELNGQLTKIKVCVKMLRSLKAADSVEVEILNFRLRIQYIKWIQFFSVFSLILATMSVFTIFFKYIQIGWILFTFSIISFLISLIISALEIKISTIALNISTKDGGDLRCS